MEKNIEITNEGGLKCDNIPACDWRDDTIKFDTYKEWLNKPCPKCGSNLLTQEDYDRSEVLRMSIDIINMMSPEELEIISKMAEANKDNIFDNPIFKDAKGLENLLQVNSTGVGLRTEGEVHITMQTHGEIKASEIVDVTKTKEKEQK